MDGFFFKQMRGLLGARYDEFKNAYDLKPRRKALRVNTLKLSVDEFVSLADRLGGYSLVPNKLCGEGFYTDVKPSLDPLYHAGLYYMQEASAQSAVEAFLPFIGERVLDLCSAPGGKATQAAAHMTGGVIFCNDVEHKRAAALVENIERLGVKNAVVTVGTAFDYLKAGFGGYFDTVIIDAPCSGGGMMRYESVPYSEEIVKGCAERQRAVLDGGAELVAPDGYLLYSTCTFSREEDEENVEYLLSKGFSTVDIPLRDGEDRGIGIADARRIYPHNFDGEGHFYCVLKKTGGATRDIPKMRYKTDTVRFGGLSIERVVGLDILPIDIPPLDGLRVVRAGVPVYDGRADRKQSGASHALTHALTHDEAASFGMVELTEDEAQRYIRGEQLDRSESVRGYFLATYCGHALGAVKIADDGAGSTVMKNLYPKKLRV